MKFNIQIIRTLLLLSYLNLAHLIYAQENKFNIGDTIVISLSNYIGEI